MIFKCKNQFLDLASNYFYHVQGLMLTEEQIKNLTLTEIERHMERNRRSLKDYKGFPYPEGYIVEQLGNRLIYDELNYNVNELDAEFQQLFATLTGIH